MLDWMRRRRNGLFVALVFLLLAMQQELALHPFEHLRGQLADAHQTALHQLGDPCDECALLSGVAHSLLDATPIAVAVQSSPPREFRLAEALAAAPPSYYRSRAPPYVL
jgi:hypothetical protein